MIRFRLIMGLGWLSTLLVFVLVHAIHLAILLLPTLILAGPSQVDVAVALFASLVTIAAVLESRFVQPAFDGASATICDVRAMHVASIVGVLLLVTFWLAQIEHFAMLFKSPLLEIVGTLFVATGIALRVQAIRTLGPAFNSDICIGSGVIDHGIYRWLRHPSEVGLLMIAIGGPVVLGSLCTAVAATVLFMPISAWRIQRENRVLASIRHCTTISYRI